VCRTDSDYIKSVVRKWAYWGDTVGSGLRFDTLLADIDFDHGRNEKKKKFHLENNGRDITTDRY
jgi:hypothetical protein